MGSLLLAAPQVAGTWKGTLTASGAHLTLVFHLSESGNGKYSASADSPDQGLEGLAVDEATVHEKRIRLQLKKVGALYWGELTSDGKISGEFQQGGVLPLELKRSPGEKGSLAGDWKGTLASNGQTLTLVLHVSRSSKGSYRGTIDSPDQGRNGIPLQDISLDGDRVWLQAKGAGVVYTGRTSKDGDQIAGDFWQGPRTTLDLSRQP